MKMRLLLLPFVSLLTLSSCAFVDDFLDRDENANNSSSTEIIPVTSVEFSLETVTVKKDNSKSLEYTILPENASNKKVSWESSNSNIARVEGGTVYGVSVGNAVITIKTEDGNKTDTCNVKVTSTPVNPPKTKNGEFYGGLVEGGEYTGYEFSKSTEEITKPSTGVGEIKVYAFNDYHGSVIKQGNEAGLKQFGTYFKEKSQEDNSLIFDQGDTWQGSFESNYEYGAIIQDVFTYAGVTARTVGNHDFDWGLSHLESTINRKVDGNYMPCLAANVYDYSNGTNGSVQQSQYGKEYCTYVLDNGIKIGLVGVIGESQITSICSQLVSSICFTNYVDKVKEISDFLRTEKDCDVIIASTHEGSGDAQTDGLTEVSSVSGKRYVDLVLGGHQHTTQEYTVNGVKYVQWSSNSQNTGKVTLKYDFATGELVDEDTTINTYNYNWLNTYYSTIDPVIEEMVDTYLSGIESVADEVLSTNFSGNFTPTCLARLITEAIYDRVSQTHPEIQFAISNYAREGFTGTTFTYRDLYKSFPFDNQIILMDVSSFSGTYSILHNYSYREDTTLDVSSGTNYKCAIIDYVALHQNSSRNFDYFPDAANGYTVFNDASGDPPTYREILYSYLKANSTKSFDAGNYDTSNPHFCN